MKDIAKLVRADLKALVASGDLPAAKFGVTISRYSGGRSLSVKVSEVPFPICNEARVRRDIAEPRCYHERELPLHSEKASAMLRTIEGVIAAYNFDGERLPERLLPRQLLRPRRLRLARRGRRARGHEGAHRGRDPPGTDPRGAGPRARADPRRGAARPLRRRCAARGLPRRLDPRARPRLRALRVKEEGQVTNDTRPTLTPSEQQVLDGVLALGGSRPLCATMGSLTGNGRAARARREAYPRAVVRQPTLWRLVRRGLVEVTGQAPCGLVWCLATFDGCRAAQRAEAERLSSIDKVVRCGHN